MELATPTSTGHEEIVQQLAGQQPPKTLHRYTSATKGRTILSRSKHWTDSITKAPTSIKQDLKKNSKVRVRV